MVKFIIGAIAVATVLIISISLFIIFTTNGSVFALEFAARHRLGCESLSVSGAEGSFARTLVIHGTEIRGLGALGVYGNMRIKEFSMRFKKFPFQNPSIKFRNAVLVSAETDVLSFDGSYEDGLLRLIAEGRDIGVNRIIDLLPREKRPKYTLNGLCDVHIEASGGSSGLLDVRGSALLKDAEYGNLIINFCPVQFDFKLDTKNGKIYGNALIKKAASIIKDSKNSTVSAQEIRISLPDGRVENMSVKLNHGTIKLDDSEPMIIHGKYEDKLVELSIYSKRIFLADLSKLSKDIVGLRSVNGTVTDVDINIKGPLSGLILSGKARVDNIARGPISIVNTNVELRAEISRSGGETRLKGKVDIRNGIAYGPNSVAVNIEPGLIFFSGDPKTPSFDLKGNATVEDVKIRIILRGGADKPDLKLWSDPPFVEDRLLLMLATGKKWSGAEDALTKGTVSTELIKDFIDYFVLGGSGEKIAKQFGLKELSIQYNGQAQGAVKIRKTLSDKATVGYGVKQSQTGPGGEPRIAHKVEGEYSMTKNLSVFGERELEQNGKDSTEKNQPKDKVILKYKKDF